MRVSLLLVRLLLCVIGAAIAFAQMSSFSERDPRYRLKPSDVLEIHYRYSPGRIRSDCRCSARRFVSLQLVGDLKIQGLTVDQAKAGDSRKSTRRLKDPKITLVLKEFEKPYFVVGGEVTNPGKFELTTPSQSRPGNSNGGSV